MLASGACAAPQVVAPQIARVSAPLRESAQTSTTTAASASALFNFNISLERTAVLVGPDGAPYIGFPVDDAEALLEVLEVRVPLMKSVIQQHEKLSARLARQNLICESMVVTSASIAADLRTVSEAWKAAALAADASWFNRIVLSTELWLIIGGVIGGAAMMQLID